MRAEKRSTGRSFIENARRAQIIDCTIDVIATVGYARASLARIAKLAGISKSVISYHFDGKDELVREVVKAVYARGGAAMAPRITAQQSVCGMLRAYIESNLGFIATHPNHVVAVYNIATALYAADREGAPHLDILSAVTELENLLRQGQRRGEFRDFPTKVMAVAIRQSIDAVVGLLAAGQKPDFETFTRELVTIFDLATRKSGASGGDDHGCNK
jgi:AcrR family transcriptional regulator